MSFFGPLSTAFGEAVRDALTNLMNSDDRVLKDESNGVAVGELGDVHFYPVDA